MDEMPDRDAGGAARALERLRAGAAGRQALLFGPADPEVQARAVDAQEQARIGELETMGLPAWQIRLARAIGYDNFLTMWRMMEAEAQGGGLRLTENESMIEVQLRRWGSFKRFQRNRFIETLGRFGMSVPEIRETVLSELGENLSESHISRLVRHARMPG